MRYKSAVFMIKHFKNKRLESFFKTGNKAGIRPDHAPRLARQLRRLDDAGSYQDMQIPGWDLHALSGDLAGYWAVFVNGNWRLIFAFDGDDAICVDYIDYH